MSFDLNDLQAVLANWPSVAYWPDKVEDSLLDRICQVLWVAHGSRRPGQWHGDLQPLVRHALLRASKTARTTINLRVPSDNGWPDAQSWAKHGIEVLEVGPSAFLLTAQEWHPDWLGSGEGGVFSDAFSDREVRKKSFCPADPFVRDATGFEMYSCPGQREAVRAAFLMPEGDTLLVNLPTGSGKSLVGQASALVHKEAGHLTLFVVPTVALALDQERAMRALFQRQDPSRADWPLAWSGGLSQEYRTEIRQRLRNGTQRILITSPEALTTSLLRAVLEAATAGMIHYLVIDEAHLITQWGDEFRPTFQALSGLRSSMLKRAPRGFRTLLMSATFTEETVDTLASLFGPRERVQMVSAVHLRPEPQYWFSGARSIEEKQERVLEALRHAPRPFILYVTKRDEVRQWNSILRQSGGLSRIATFDGKTPPSERLRIIREWAANRLDGIVATSAFGVGLDKDDVRTVIHATIPETLDRYYQEVGRGGRDGKPSVSLMVFEDADWNLPKRLAKPRIISDELGFSRWNAMYRSRRATSEENLWEIDIDAVRTGLLGGSEENVNWNMRTLILMARARLIALELENNPDETLEEPGEDASSLLAAIANMRVRILDYGHLTERWEEAISASRSATLQAAGRNLQMMHQLLPGSSRKEAQVGKEVGETLCQLYRITSPQWPVYVSHACGGCPSDRFEPIEHGHYAEPVAIPVNRVVTSRPEAWLERFPWLDPSFVFVFYDETQPESTIRQDFIRFAAWLVQCCGVREISINPASSFAQLPEWNGLYKRARDKVVLHRSLMEFDMEPYSPLARMTLLDPDASLELVQKVQMLQRPFHLVLLPLALPDPGNRQRRLYDVSPNKIRLDDLIQEIIQ
ncbi:protein DpdF [Candidatus Methylomicrobium oryzae]|uniref:protein DpdF n=1 Tax=Candidatus Methylomicrobium oryzae TaxID=2802053 RepID=UPI00192258BE|nr:protein DpdF [Methylomicrobium sp. RS1]MBL1265485.1 ATP-dependent DNA helicase RecQ [Methylomicrobium sp. RS1]